MSTGWHSGDDYKEGCWYDLIALALGDSLVDEETPEGPARRLAAPQTGEPDGAEETSDVHEAFELPTWALMPASAEPTPSIPLSPSRPEDEPPAQSPFSRDDPGRFKRGQLIHRLLQSLPDVPRDGQDAAGLRLLTAHGVSETDAKAWVAETMAVIYHPDHAALFGPGSLAEVPVIGTVEDRVISAQIDRLVVLEDRVMIVDFKTNRPPPTSPANIPPVYLRQMAGYRKLVEGLYPNKRIEEFLLWTDGPRLMALD